MARRRFTVRDITEILEHWQAGRSISAMSRSLEVSRATVRKYVYSTQARGYHPGDPTPAQGWKAFLREVIPKPPDPSTRSQVFATQASVTLIQSGQMCGEKQVRVKIRTSCQIL